jgi:uncharacterized membrane protein
VSASFDSVAPLAVAGLRFVPPLALLWLAFFFGRTLRAGEMPLIERVARIGKPDLSVALCRYTRRLTALWCVYFVVAATLTAAASLGFQQASLGVAAVSLVFFVGEYWVRQCLFPQEVFPDLVQQVRDTVHVWRPRRDA